MGLLHGVGAETPTQVLVFAAAANASGRPTSVGILLCFVAGLVVANSLVAVASTFGFANVARNRLLTAGITAIAVLFSLTVGTLLVPASLLPLWALGLGAVSGFPIDDVWHREYGVDVTMWSPPHMLMILGATFTGMAAWLILAESGVRPTDGRWARGIHVVCGWLTLQGLVAPQGEFAFGVPQFNALFSPILICVAAGFGMSPSVSSSDVVGRSAS